MVAGRCGPPGVVALWELLEMWIVENIVGINKDQERVPTQGRNTMAICAKAPEMSGRNAGFLVRSDLSKGNHPMTNPMDHPREAHAD